MAGILCFVWASTSYARNVTCRVIDQQEKIVGTYVHSAPSFPSCSCDNPDIPEELKSVCVSSLRTF